MKPTTAKKVSAFSVFKNKRLKTPVKKVKTPAKVKPPKKEKKQLKAKPVAKKAVKANSITKKKATTPVPKSKAKNAKLIPENTSVSEILATNNDVSSSIKTRKYTKRVTIKAETPVTKKSAIKASLKKTNGTIDEPLIKEPSIKKLELDNEEMDHKNEPPVETFIAAPVSPYMFDSRVEAIKCFQWLIHPVQPEKFFSDLWEKKPLLVKRHNPNYFKNVFSCEQFDHILREKQVMFGKNIDITSYLNGERQTHNPAGRAFSGVVWDFYQNGYSVRFLNPQTFCKSIWKLNSTLQDYFGSFVGSNIYLTPPESQGFAPHYDDIEAFVLQLEGKKKWKLYNPRSLAETLPRFSSGNFKQDEIGEPILDVELEPGDLLYFPRGTIHQACTDSAHSLHVTVSTCQKNTYGDLMQLLLPRAMEIALEENVEFRESLPRDYLSFMGVANCDLESKQRESFMAKVKTLLEKLFNYCPIDSTVDQLGKNLMHDSLPPLLTKYERDCSVHSCGERWNQNKVTGAVELTPDTELKLIRGNILRLVTEENTVRIYHCLYNPRQYHQEEPQYFEILPELAPAVEYLVHSYPKFVAIEDLPLDAQQDKMEIATILYEKGLVISDGPLNEIEN